MTKHNYTLRDACLNRGGYNLQHNTFFATGLKLRNKSDVLVALNLGINVMMEGKHTSDLFKFDGKKKLWVRIKRGD